MYSFSLGDDKTKVNYEITDVGEDIEIHITGGFVHVGCIGLVSDGNYNIISVQNHKEHEIIQPMAKKLVKYDDLTILIVSGIHYDDITLDEIKEILDNNLLAIEKIDKFIQSEYNIFHEFK